MHARDAAIEGSKALVIKANVTDIVVIAVSVLPQLQEIGVETLWTAFGHGVGMKWIPIHELCTQCHRTFEGKCIRMPSLNEMWFLPSEEMGRNRHGRHEMYLMRSRKPSVTLASSRLKLHILI